MSWPQTLRFVAKPVSFFCWIIHGGVLKLGKLGLEDRAIQGWNRAPTPVRA